MAEYREHTESESNFQIIWDDLITNTNTETTNVQEMSFEEFYERFGIDARVLDDSFEMESDIKMTGNDEIQEVAAVHPPSRPETEEFINMSSGDVTNAIQAQANINTSKKTGYDLMKFERFLRFKKEDRQLSQISVDELDEYMANFLLSIRKNDGEEYQPSSVRGFISSFDRELRRIKYPYTVAGHTGPQFSLTRSALSAKTKLLKKSGKGNKPNAAGALTDEEINTLFEKGLLGGDSPQAFLNTIWLNNCIHFGLRGTTENYNLRWGDVTMKQLPDGSEYLELNERQTKTRTGENIADVRKVSPKMFATNDDRDPVSFYKLYASKRPKNLSRDDDPFYLATRTKPLNPQNPDCAWFLSQRVGVKKLGGMLKTMSKDAGLAETGKRLTNHSARKHLVQKLRDANVPPTEIIQISGHKNVQSVLNYSGISENKQKECSYLLSNHSSRPVKIPASATISSCNDLCCRPPITPPANPNPDILQTNVPSTAIPFQDLTSSSASTANITPRPVGIQNIDQISVSETMSLNSHFFGAVFHVQNFNVYQK